MDIIITILASISAACSDRKNLPKALISGGIFNAAAALCLVFFQGPGGVFLHHGKGAYYLYYGILVAIAVFGLVEAAMGGWVFGRLDDRHAAGKAVLYVSILPLICVAAFGGFVVLRKVN
ncbi:hypothetical protein CFC21_090457 [Triticum aestivum]|uniref:Uncharacterized protein n=2 Tax=Triticum aestivum TaxID=4565 RepID=A0A9R1MRY6_WHEAT|nr:hypothetical protein CFC21_090451 [Triticum aestivum]KAF7087261.1 hypothetical protein CFC21_090457 [Triticum aestivum]